jgi:hypothetical protein
VKQKNGWPWTILRGFKVSSLANGNILIEPDYVSKWTPETGGGPGMFERMDLAAWVHRKILARRPQGTEIPTDTLPPGAPQ